MGEEDIPVRPLYTQELDVGEKNNRASQLARPKASRAAVRARAHTFQAPCSLSAKARLIDTNVLIDSFAF